jgi:hypothetical protein
LNEGWRSARETTTGEAMAQITRELLDAYLDDALSDRDTAEVEQALRDSDPLRRLLRAVMQERDRGEHSVGAIWRRERLTCPSREQLGSYLLEVLEPAFQEYVEFHLQTIACPFCRANVADLKNLHQEPGAKASERRRRFFESSAGYLQVARSKP